MILFIDFDGVLHPIQRSEPDFCRLELLWKILRACPNVEVVFSTSWREIYSTQELVMHVTNGGGEDLTHRFIGSNPGTPRARSTYVAGAQPARHVECERWLAENGQQHRAWLALDDIPEIFPPSSHTLYLVNGRTGLTEVDVGKIIDMLTQGRNQLMNEGEKYCQSTVAHGFIDDECAAQKDERRREFAKQVKFGLAKSTDASMFHGMAAESKVKYRDEEF